MTRMQMGANIPLAEGPLRASLRWTSGPDVPEVDLTALLLRADGKVGGDVDFVFYNQPAHPSGAVRLVGDALEIDPAAVPADVVRVVLAASATGGTFGQVPNLELQLDAAGAAVAIFGMTATSETAFVCAELYRRDAQWKFRAVGQGYANGLAGLAADFGITAGDAPAAPPPTPARSATPPAPASPPTPARPAAPPRPAAPTGSSRGALDLDAPWPPR